MLTLSALALISAIPTFSVLVVLLTVDLALNIKSKIETREVE